VPDTEIALRVPPHCIRCGAEGTIKLQTAVKGSFIELEWCCTACDVEWAVKRRDENPRAALPPAD